MALTFDGYPDISFAYDIQSFVDPEESRRHR